MDGLDADGRTALMLACHNGQPEFARKLLEFGARKNLKDKQGMQGLRCFESFITLRVLKKQLKREIKKNFIDN